MIRGPSQTRVVESGFASSSAAWPSLITALAVFPVVPLFLTDEVLREHVWILYVCVLVIVNVLFLMTPDHIKTFFSPSALMTNFVLVWSVMGSVGFHYGWVGNVKYGLSDYFLLEHLDIATSFFLSAVLVAVLVMHWTYDIWVRLPVGGRGVDSSLALAALVLAAGVSILARIDLPGAASFGPLVSGLSMMALALFARFRNRRLRFALYTLIVGYTAATSVADKRLVVFVMVALLLVELHQLHRIRVTTRTVALFAVAGLILIGTVTGLSIQRGHGQLETSNLGESIAAIPRYLELENSTETLFINFEWTLSYFHSVNAVEVVVENPDYLLLGESYVKALMVPIPRSFAPFKPDSHLGTYTERIDPTFRSIGGSWPPNAFAEAFSNFQYFGGLAAIMAIFGGLNILFYSMLRVLRTSRDSYLVLYITWYMLLFAYFRGFGIDGLLATSAVVAVAFAGLQLIRNAIAGGWGTSPSR